MFITKQYKISKQKVEPKVEMVIDEPPPPPKKMRGAGLDQLIDKIKDVTLKDKKTSKITF